MLAAYQAILPCSPSEVPAVSVGLTAFPMRWFGREAVSVKNTCCVSRAERQKFGSFNEHLVIIWILSLRLLGGKRRVLSGDLGEEVCFPSSFVPQDHITVSVPSRPPLSGPHFCRQPLGRDIKKPGNSLGIPSAQFRLEGFWWEPAAAHTWSVYTWQGVIPVLEGIKGQKQESMNCLHLKARCPGSGLDPCLLDFSSFHVKGCKARPSMWGACHEWCSWSLLSLSYSLL